ncbi:MAG: proline iminopeptidase-family hydrolase, partial [Smithella sp.]
MNVHEQYIETEQGRLWAAVYGEGTKGVPLLVLHGGPGFLSMPREICDLADERPVIFYDQLGCGRSDRPSDTSLYTVSNYVRELARVREVLGIEQLHLMGFSWGAMLAAEYILRNRPRGVTSLILCGPLLSTPFWERDQRNHISHMPTEAIRVIAAAEASKFYTEDYQRVMMDYYRSHVCRLNPWPTDLTEAVEKLNMDVYLTMWGPSEFTVTGELKDTDLLPRLKEIRQPTLLTCGEHDEAAPETVGVFCDQLPRGEMTILPDA